MVALEFSSQILCWVELHVPALSVGNILSVENWQTDYLSHLVFGQGE